MICSLMIDPESPNPPQEIALLAHGPDNRFRCPLERRADRGLAVAYAYCFAPSCCPNAQSQLAGEGGGARGRELRGMWMGGTHRGAAAAVRAVLDWGLSVDSLAD